MVELTIQRKQEKPETLFKSACGCWAVVRRDYMNPNTKSGIIITAGGMKELRQEVATGEVLCVGDGSNPHMKSAPVQSPPCHGGDRIMWSRYGERLLEEREEGDLVAIPFPEIIGVIC